MRVNRCTPIIAAAIVLMLILIAATSTAQVERQLSSTQAQPGAAPLVLTFQDAVVRAKANLPQFLTAKTDYGLAHQDKVQARAALLPSVTYNSQFIYTQPNGTPSGVFIANNSVHEYVSQGNAHEVSTWGAGRSTICVEHKLRRRRHVRTA